MISFLPIQVNGYYNTPIKVEVKNPNWGMYYYHMYGQFFPVTTLLCCRATFVFFLFPSFLTQWPKISQILQGLGVAQAAVTERWP